MIGSIESTLIQHLLTHPGLPDLDHENTRYRPVTGRPFIMVNLLPAEPDLPIIGDEAPVQQVGILSLLLHYPLGVGAGTAGNLADALVAHFAKGKVLIPTGTPVRPAVRITKSWRGIGRETESYYTLPVTVRYSAYTQA